MVLVMGVQIQIINNVFEYGVGIGMVKVMDWIFQYYIKFVDKLFLIVEVDGGCVVDIVFICGVLIERK